ncbi:MAG: type I restriction enzyme HsdR N-terminal domain-containing protein, partial [bacterium]|nr:type I restriction enzyme HsdR N-terminal domain-containing protein [bacterium]
MKTIHELKEEFEKNYGLYANNESQTRQSLIDVMLVNLGWDVTDPNIVRVEPPVETESGKKKADYILYDDRGQPAVVIEAKAPKVKVAQDKSAIFQVLRYGWNLETVSVGVLTDFEEWEVYNTSTKPSKETNRFRIPDLCCTYKEYADKWDTLAGYFSRQAVLDGKLRAYATTTKVSLPPDEAFLKDLESYRLLIAQALVKNERLAHDWDLSEYTQRVLDRLLLLRILEDRGYGERGGWLYQIAEANDPGQHLSDLVSRLQPTYNSRFFERHPVDALHLEPDKIRAVVKELADPDAVYDFSAMPVEIIGKAYEKFLGSQVRITPARRVKIEPKPEVRKAGGVYYTPRYIVDYIVENTLSPLFEGRSPSQAAKIKILDPACGSGSFLIGAARWLERWYSDKYGRPLTHEDRRTIVLRHLHGVDIDANAVEVTQLSLCLWLLEKAPLQMDMSHVALLPDLSGNVRCGNSLIGSDFYSGDQKDLFEDDAVRRRVNAFDWDGPNGWPEIMKRGGFDDVIGNPPYVSFGLRGVQKVDNTFQNYIRSSFPNSAEYKLSTYALFLDRAVQIANVSGYISFILPDSFLIGRYFSKLRRFLLNTCCLLDFSMYNSDFWPKATIGLPTIIVAKREKENSRRNNNQVKARLVETPPKISPEFSYMQSYYETVVYNRFRLFFNESSYKFVKKIETTGVPASRIISIHTGVRSKIGQKSIIASNSKGASWKQGLISGREIGRYQLEYAGNYLNIDPKFLWSGGWDKDVVQSDKILIRQTGDSLTATLDLNNFYHLNNIHSAVLVDSSYDIRYLLGIFNSRLLNHFYHLISLELGRAMAQTDIETLEKLPIYIIDFNNKEEIAKHDRMVSP